MPSHRKRIGYLPSEKIHMIIDEMGKNNNYSQSKVTGILVEEALIARGILKVSEAQRISEEYTLLNNLKAKEISPSDISTRNTNFNIKTDNKFKEDLDYINEFIEYKLFKKIIGQNYKNLF